MKNGETYRGLMVDAEDNMNAQMQNVLATGRDGTEYKLQYVYIRGSHVRFMIMPDMLKNSPMFKRFDKKNRNKQPDGLGFGTKLSFLTLLGVSLIMLYFSCWSWRAQS